MNYNKRVDIYSILGKIRTGASLAESLLDNKGMPTPEVALAGIFDRRFSTVPSFLKSTASLIYAHYLDLPRLREREEVRFKTSDKYLAGYLYKHPNPIGIVICVHGIFSLADNHNALIADYFLSKGYTVFAIDLSSSGRSEGTSIPGLHQGAIDVAMAVSYVRSRKDLSSFPICLFGHSWGAYSVAASLSFDPSPVAIACCSGFKDPLSIMVGLPKSKIGPIAEATVPALKEAMKERGGELSFLSAEKAINDSNGTKAIIVHGDLDSIIPLGEAALINASFKSNKPKTLIYKGKGHGDIYYSLDAISFANKAKEKANEYEKEYGKSIDKWPKEIIDSFKKEFPKGRSSCLDEEMFGQIEMTFREACR